MATTITMTVEAEAEAMRHLLPTIAEIMTEEGVVVSTTTALTPATLDDPHHHLAAEVRSHADGHALHHISHVHGRGLDPEDTIGTKV